MLIKQVILEFLARFHRQHVRFIRVSAAILTVYPAPDRRSITPGECPSSSRRAERVAGAVQAKAIKYQVIEPEDSPSCIISCVDVNTNGVMYEGASIRGHG